jgi:hypothetical protein
MDRAVPTADRNRPRKIHRRILLLAVLLSWVPPSVGARDATCIGQPEWLRGDETAARWLAGGDRRAILNLRDNTVEVILCLKGRDADDIVERVLRYDVHRRTTDVETSFQADGVFFTGTRVAGSFTPTLTAFELRRSEGAMVLSWRSMPPEDARGWLEEHRPQLREALAEAGVDKDVDRYLEQITKSLDKIALVTGAHEFQGGWYRYSQRVEIRNALVRTLVERAGRQRQMRAALKAACFSVGMDDWAGSAGHSGPNFEVRGDGAPQLRPGP